MHELCRKAAVSPVSAECFSYLWVYVVVFIATYSMRGMFPFFIAIAIGQPWKMLPAVIFAPLLQLTSLTLSMTAVCVRVSVNLRAACECKALFRPSQCDVHVCGTCINSHECNKIVLYYVQNVLL